MSLVRWRRGLLLCLLCFCVCSAEECVHGVVGRPVSLPCLSPQPLPLANFTIEWRRAGEVVLRAVFEENRNVEQLSLNSATIPDDAALTGNFSLELPAVEPKEHNRTYRLVIISEEDPGAAMCAVCLRVAASFSAPQLHREQAAQEGQLAFTCRSIGGFPEPAVRWLINNTEEPPEGSVRTVAESLPDSQLYNITSYLTTNISQDSSVSCTIENQPMNETLTSTICGGKDEPVGGRASEAMWIFSTALCAVVGVLVVVGVGYQIHLDRISKKKKCAYEQSIRGMKRRSQYKENEENEETEVMRHTPKETDV